MDRSYNYTEVTVYEESQIRGYISKYPPPPHLTSVSKWQLFFNYLILVEAQY